MRIDQGSTEQFVMERAEAAYSVAQVLSLRGEEAQWVDDVSSELTLPTLTSCSLFQSFAPCD